MAGPFAQADDLQDRWLGRTLSSSELTYAGTLLADASDMIRERWPDVDARIDAGTLRHETLRRIVCTMVKTAMVNGDTEGVESIGVTTGPFSDTRKFSNPNGNLYFTAEMVRSLDGYKKRRAFAVDL